MSKVVAIESKRKKVSPVDPDTEYVIVCAECESTAFEIASDTHPEVDDDWEVSAIRCSKCGTIIFEDGENI